MKFLMIEDDSYKGQKVIDALVGHEVEVKISYNSGMRALIANEYDAVILDMAFPVFDDGDGLKSDQGQYVLSEMERRKIELPVLIHSGEQHDVSEYDFVLGYILANAFVSIDGQMKEFIEKVEEIKSQRV